MACVTVAAAYAVGYAIAAVWSKVWFKPVERWNFAVSLLVLAVIAALFSPLVDPMCISVASQLARLESGKVAPEKFDFWYLRHDGGRFGKAALERLAKSPNAKIVAPAENVLRNRGFLIADATPAALTTQELTARLHVHPQGAKLPASFLDQGWNSTGDSCLTGDLPKGWVCDAVLKDVDGDGVAEVVLSYGAETSDMWKQIRVYRQEHGRWAVISQFDGQLCKGEFQALLAGRAQGVLPQQRDLQIGGRRLAMTPSTEQWQGCQ